MQNVEQEADCTSLFPAFGLSASGGAEKHGRGGAAAAGHSVRHTAQQQGAPETTQSALKSVKHLEKLASNFLKRYLSKTIKGAGTGAIKKPAGPKGAFVFLPASPSGQKQRI